MIGKGQQIKELTNQLAEANARACALAAEKAALTDALAVAEEQTRLLRRQLPESLESSLSQKTLDRARELLTGAMKRSKQLLADAQQQSDDLLASARTEAQTAREESDALMQAAHAEAESLVQAAREEAEALAGPARIAAQAARQEADALLEAAKADAETATRQRMTRVEEALARLSQENNALTLNLRRQSLALMHALSEAADTVLRFDAEPDECKAILSDSLAAALKSPADISADEDALAGTVTLHSRAEFDAVGSYGFRSNALLSRVILPADGVSELPESFFFGCPNLTEVTLPMTMETIGGYAFFSCARLKTVLLPRELEHIGPYAFSCCHALGSLRIPGGVKDVGVAAFRSCESLAEIRFERDGCLRQLGSHAFQNCTSLSACALPNGLTLLPTSLFYGCERLAEMDIPAGITRMQADVFEGCTSLRCVRFHNPELVLEPGATAGLEHVQLTLSGKTFAWAEVTAETTLRELIDSPAIMNEAENNAADAPLPPEAADGDAQAQPERAADAESAPAEDAQASSERPAADARTNPDAE